MSESAAKPVSLLGAVRQIGVSLLALAENRLRLFALDLQLEKLRLVELLIGLGLGLMFAGLGLITGTVTLGLFLWETTGFLGLTSLTILLLGMATVVIWRLHRRIQTGPGPFAGTIEEFKNDQKCLQKKN